MRATVYTRIGRLIAIDLQHAMQAIDLSIISGNPAPASIARARRFIADLEKTLNDIEAAELPAREQVEG